MTEYTITRFDPDTGTIEVQFANWVDAIAIPVTLDSMGMLPTGAALDALIGSYAPSADEVARRFSVSSATNQEDLSALIGTTRTADVPPAPAPPTVPTAAELGLVLPYENAPKASVVV
jgi:hypothetical protein